MIVENLSKSYFGNRVVDNVSFEIPKGKITSFIGPNGAGKSTVMGLISRLVQMDSGSVKFKGKELKKWKSKELSKNLAILSQTNNINIKLTIKELVSFGRFPYSSGRLTKEDKDIVKKALLDMELLEISDKFIDELSGGQRQRAFIAMILAQDTEFVLLDEPTNNLDIYHSTTMMKNIRRLCDEFGKSVIMVLHELNLASYYSDYICAFKDGKIMKFGTSQEVMTCKNLKELYGVDFEILNRDGKNLCMYC